jgi:glycine/D-amino acid oxidase-like deaminating enzyme
MRSGAGFMTGPVIAEVLSEQLLAAGDPSWVDLELFCLERFGPDA